MIGIALCGVGGQRAAPASKAAPVSVACRSSDWRARS
jgi:hypothetical protein